MCDDNFIEIKEVRSVDKTNELLASGNCKLIRCVYEKVKKPCEPVQVGHDVSRGLVFTDFIPKYKIPYEEKIEIVYILGIY